MAATNSALAIRDVSYDGDEEIYINVGGLWYLLAWTWKGSKASSNVVNNMLYPYKSIASVVEVAPRFDNIQLSLNFSKPFNKLKQFIHVW